MPPRIPERTLGAAQAAELGEQKHPAIRWFQDDVKTSYLGDDNRSTPNGRLVWHEWMPGVLRTTDRMYAIIRVFIPDRGPDGFRATYLLREAGSGTDSWGPNFLGITAGDYPRLDFALQQAETRAWKREVGAAQHVPDSLPDALAYITFRAGDGFYDGLAVERTEDGNTVVRVYSMERTNDDGTERYAVAELDITDVLARKNRRPEVGPDTPHEVIIREAIVTALMSRGDESTTSEELTNLIGADLAARELTATGAAVRVALNYLVSEGWVSRTAPDNYMIIAERRREITSTTLLHRSGRLQAVRDEVLQCVKTNPGLLEYEILDRGTFFGVRSEVAAELRAVVAQGKVAVRDGKHYDDAYVVD